MPDLRYYHVMISHSWDYTSDYTTIKSWLNNASNFLWSDYSVPVSKPLDAKTKTELKNKLHDRIAKCSCIVIPSGMYVSYSEWIDFEIDTATALGKPIIGVEPWGNERVPLKIQNYADVIVGWNSSSVINAIRQYAL